jgi:glycosyltransferase involved in cell wall biosynthesis
LLYICIPVYNEAPTIGVLLGRIRKVFQEYPREYEVLVYDDGSTDASAETIEPYTRVLPLTVLGGREHKGYAVAVEALLRTAARKTRYPRRDAIVLMQGDFTDQPEHLPELLKRFEGGADLVVAEREPGSISPVPARRLRFVAPWLLRPFVSVPGIRDPFGSFRLFRISVLRDVLKSLGEAPLLESAGWSANVDLLMKTMPHARRIETVAADQRYDVRPRPSRVRPLSDAVDLYKFGWSARRRPRIAAVPNAPAAPAPQPPRA